jgi:methionine synthase II (cobalamin-independent)
MSHHFRSNEIFHTFGSDYAYSDSINWYENLDLIKDYINERKDQFGMEVVYSNPDDYLKAIN